MEVLVGTTFAAAHIRDRNGVAAQDTVPAGAAAAYVRDKKGVGAQDKVSVGAAGLMLEDSPESSSSIGGTGNSSEDDEEEDDVVSSREGLSSLSSLQDSLPIKRGLSNHYMGKSKSFGNLSEAGSLKDLEKPENPFNKKRRVLIANKRRASSSFYSWQKNPKSMPLLAALNENEEDSESETQTKDQNLLNPNMNTWSCVSLAELDEDNQ